MISLFERHVERIRETQPGQFMGLCPFHEDRNPSFSFTAEGVFNCFACKIRGNASTFARLVGDKAQKGVKMGVSKIKAKVWSIPGVLGEDMQDHVFKCNDRLLLNYKRCVGDLPWNKEIVKRLFIGWDNGLLFPYLNGEGDLVNIKWHKRRQVKGHSQTFIFPYWHMLTKYKKNRTLFIMEGEKDAVSLISHGRQAITFNNGANSNVPGALISIIKARFDDITIKYDSDQAGSKAEAQILRLHNG